MFPSSLLLIRGRSGQAAGQGPRAVPLLPASRDGAVLPAPWERRKCHPAPTQRARWYLAAGAVKSYTRKNIFSCFWAESPGGYGAGPIPTSPCSPAPKYRARPSWPCPKEAQSETRPPCEGEPPGVPWEGGLMLFAQPGMCQMLPASPSLQNTMDLGGRQPQPDPLLPCGTPSGQAASDAGQLLMAMAWFGTWGCLGGCRGQHGPLSPRSSSKPPCR